MAGRGPAGGPSGLDGNDVESTPAANSSRPPRPLGDAPTGLAGGLTDNDALGQDVYDPVSGYTTRLPAGFFENIYINYIYTATSTDFGRVVEMRAKLPTHPHTYYGESPMGTGQVRFWSMCTANYPSTATYACAVDKDMPLDRRGDFTLVISSPADRPANAFARCGVACATPTSLVDAAGASAGRCGLALDGRVPG